VVVVAGDVTVTVWTTVEITVEMLVTVNVVAVVTVRQILLIDVGDPPAPVEMPPTKSAARAAVDMSLRIMSSLLSGEADVSGTACSVNNRRDGETSEASVEARGGTAGAESMLPRSEPSRFGQGAPLCRG
jgi:hypothetical protein